MLNVSPLSPLPGLAKSASSRGLSFSRRLSFDMRLSFSGGLSADDRGRVRDSLQIDESGLERKCQAVNGLQLVVGIPARPDLEELWSL